MTTEVDIEKIRPYFTDDEWENLPDFAKYRYANIKVNYELMLNVGLTPPIPEFLKAKPSAQKPHVRDGSRTFAEEPGLREAAAQRYPKRDRKEIRYEEESDDGGSPGQVGAPAGVASSGHRYPRRSRKVVDYTEGDGDDSGSEYLFCEDCDQDYPGDCPVHGPLTHVEDTPVPEGDPQRANKTVPDCLVIRRSSIKGAQYGVFAAKPLPKRLYFGPYEGVRVDSVDKGNGYAWRVRGAGRSFLVDARPLDKSNWMRYVNCAPSEAEQNVVAFERAGAVYYRTRKPIEAYEELLVWYGNSFARELGLLKDRDATGKEDKENAGDPRQQQERIPCETCGVVFLSRECLDRHMRDKHAEKPQRKFRCSQCSYSSDRSADVATHERTHTGERPFVCRLCRKGFTLKGNLRKHQRAVHARERPHECEVCGQRFTRASDLARHRRLVHTRDGPSLACPQCGKGFTRKDNLNAHLLIHTGERPHACATCRARFTFAGNLKKHVMVVHHRQYPHRCPHCGMGFAVVTHLRNHLRVRHRGEEEGAAGESEE
ncbi:histone-lysine N-methyltransferase PRDM9-like [Haemaphysalis longicornis]